MRVTAFCPGHITGFFFPCLHEDPLRSGSRGAGMCVSLGATTTVQLREGTGKVKVRINGQVEEAPVTRATIKNMIGQQELDVDVDTVLDLPMHAGFGMSAAGALSTAFALAELLERGPQDAFSAAHLAELSNRSGLGDVAALSRGGLTFRRREGLPPYGFIDLLASSLDIVAGVVGPAMRTSDVLGDPVSKERVLRVGRECYDDLVRHPTVDDFFRLSREFAMRSGIATPRVKEALSALDGLGEGSMIMLGNSVFARGDLDAIEEVLAEFGPTYRLSLDNHGPRVLVEER